jgi:uncharacterized protein (TIGR02145 family)
VWVFVDYNKAGVMKRLPLRAGATLTAHTAPDDVGKVIKVPGNTDGVWVVGNAKTASSGSFSATVQLLTATATATGACAYASNYPPVGEYISLIHLSFTGTPAYNIVLKNEENDTIYRTSGADFDIPADYTLVSFTDATGAPGIFACVPPAITVHPTASTSTCSGGTVQLSVTASSATAYQWKKGSANVLDGTGGTTANYTTAPLSGNATYTVVVSNGACSTTSNSALVTIYGAVSPGAITTASTTTFIGTAPTVTVGSSQAATGGSGNLTYLWVRTGGTGAATLTGSNATYALNADAANYAAAGTYYFNRYVKDGTCNTAPVASSGTYTLKVVSGINQPQGSCTFTQPAVVGTFAKFHETDAYASSTYVTLTDERDSKNYTVVKIGGRWIMAQNLNYQTGLTWQANSKSPSTYSSSACTACIGSFWCPGGYSSSTGTSTRESCNVWGALYSWETAMMLDGKWTSSGHSSSSWAERTGYGTYTSSANTQNHGQSDAGATTGGRGICPPNWHVPSDGEWGDILNAMETGTKNHNTSTGWIGTNAGTRGKSKCTVSDNSTSGNTYVSDTQANWYYNSSALGTDVYGFRGLPAGYRYNGGSNFSYRGTHANFWSSSARDGSYAWYREFPYSAATVYRGYYYNRSSGFSVRCIRD